MILCCSNDDVLLTACRLAGKAAFGLGNVQHATASYRKAVQLNSGGAPAWMGLAEVAESSGDAALAVQAYEQLVSHAKGSMSAPVLDMAGAEHGHLRTHRMMCCMSR